MPDLPKWLLHRVERVTRERSQLNNGEFRQERREVVLALRARGLTDTSIAEMLGVTQQYLSKTYPRGES